MPSEEIINASERDFEKQMKQPIVGYLEATVRIPILEGDRCDPVRGPGDGWEWFEGGVHRGNFIAIKRHVTEVSRRIIGRDGKPIERLSIKPK